MSGGETIGSMASAIGWRACLKHLLTSRVEAWRAGKRHTVGQLLDDLRSHWGASDGMTLSQANVELAQAGLAVMPPGVVDPDREKGWALAIPNERELYILVP